MHQPESREQRIYYGVLRTSWFTFPGDRYRVIFRSKKHRNSPF